MMIALSGCASVTLIFNPVNGPPEATRAIYTTSMLLPLNGQTLNVSLKDGEVFKGPWQGVDPVNPAAASSPEIEHAWDFVYGSGYYRAHVLGSTNHGRALLTGPAGSTAIVELNNGRGVALDNHTNVYKVTVQNTGLQ